MTEHTGQGDKQDTWRNKWVNEAGKSEYALNTSATLWRRFGSYK
jgi:hypothetical protein